MANYNEWVKYVSDMYYEMLEGWVKTGHEPCKWKMLLPDDKKVIAMVSYSNNLFRLSNGDKLPVEIDNELTRYINPNGKIEFNILIVPVV